ncbi:hypothetical protein [Streptomyces sp. NPDC051636]|uniref:hypothetical protein n=1 Tax=Streptomyces sp. NPDC051636 TaxID=3365663 RepID=UPI0037A0210B
MAQHLSIPAVDFTPTGRALPYIPAQPSERPENVVAANACPVFSDCEDVEPGHYDHYSHSLKVTEDDGVTPVITAGMAALSGEVHAEDHHAVIYVHNAEFTDAASVHAKTAEIRRMLDQVDAMATRVFADHKARTEQKAAQA